jgi:hypothetical protein
MSRKENNRMDKEKKKEVVEIEEHKEKIGYLPVFL